MSPALIVTALVASTPAVDAVLAEFQKVEYLEAAWQETKHLDLLVVPLTSSGKLHYLKGGRLLRITDQPERSSLRVDDSGLAITSGDQFQKIDFSTHPGLRALVEGFVLLLEGNKAALERAYSLDFRPSDQGWSLTLSPRSEDLKKLVRSMRFSGTGARLQRSTIVEASGDTAEAVYSVLSTTKPAPKRLARLFPAP